MRRAGSSARIRPRAGAHASAPRSLASRSPRAQCCLGILNCWDKVVAYLKLLARDKSIGKTCAYLLACMTGEQGLHRAYVSAAAIVAGSLYVPALSAIETLQAQGRRGVAQTSALMQHVFEWTRAAALDATDIFKMEVQLDESEARAAPPLLVNAISGVAGWERRGKHDRVFVIEPLVKTLVEAGLDKFARVFWHHTVRFQVEALDPEDPAWKRAGGELAEMREDQLDKCERAMLTGSFVESCQGDWPRARARRAICTPLTRCAHTLPLQARSSTSTRCSRACAPRTSAATRPPRATRRAPGSSVSTRPVARQS